jgi:hypothetical protein
MATATREEKRNDVRRRRLAWPSLIIALSIQAPSHAEFRASPGDTLLRDDLQLLNDTGATNLPLTAWPLSWADIHNSLAEAEFESLAPDVQAALERVWGRLSVELDVGFAGFDVSAGVAEAPRIIRSFEDTPREETMATLGAAWQGERFSLRLNATYADDPSDGDEFRPDGTYAGLTLGNWMLSAGWQERWWGPGRDSSLILSTNARPMPSIGIQRNVSRQSDSKWFRWIGPWTLTSFMGLMDDDRVVEDGLLWGFRFTFRPVRGLEIGINRTAQWCGEGRDCSLRAFLRVLNGNDNKGANVDEEDEPGNQLAGFDVRWSLPKQIPVALYMQWIAEDTRRTGAQLHQWLQQVGVEHWGRVGRYTHRTHFEVSSTRARLGALGEGSFIADNAYNHFIFETGYRYRSRVIGHGIDGDGLSWSLGTTLANADGNTWNASIRHMRINRIGEPDRWHSLSATPQVRSDIQLSHDRTLGIGRIYLGVGYQWLSDDLSGEQSDDFQAFVRWSSR